MNYRVQIQPSGHEFTVEAGETLLDAALHQGFAFPYGCRNGSCGSCKGKVLSGAVRYEDDELPEGISADKVSAGLALFCQAMPSSDVTVEVREVAELADIQVKMLPCRMSPSWAVDATRAPSRVNHLPRTRPRAPDADGLSTEYKSH